MQYVGSTSSRNKFNCIASKIMLSHENTAVFDYVNRLQSHVFFVCLISLAIAEEP